MINWVNLIKLINWVNLIKLINWVNLIKRISLTLKISMLLPKREGAYKIAKRNPRGFRLVLRFLLRKEIGFNQLNSINPFKLDRKVDFNVSNSFNWIKPKA